MTRIEYLWEKLHEKGIYTEEQLYKEATKNQLDIGIFTTPLRTKELRQ